MANKVIKFKDIKEDSYESIARYNVDNGVNFYLFNPMNITDFKCSIGTKNNKPVYLHEFVQCMWGNDEIDEYVFLDNAFENEIKVFESTETKTLTVNDINIKYLYTKGLFSRHIFNALTIINGVTYYLYIKTIEEKRFEKIVKEFILEQISQN